MKRPPIPTEASFTSATRPCSTDAASAVLVFAAVVLAGSLVTLTLEWRRLVHESPTSGR